MEDRRIGVFICYCGGNISDYVEVEKVRAAVENEPGVVLAKTQMFACSDAAQDEMISDIKEKGLDGIVVASCSPKLHLYTFRAMSLRAGLNPFRYTQSNIREQCSWAHRDGGPFATEKAIRIVRAGIARARLSEPLATMRIETTPKVLVLGAGVAGLMASLTLADIGLPVFLVEKEPEVGGWTCKWGGMFPQGNGSDLVEGLLKKVKQREDITLFTRAEIIERTGSVGDFTAKIRVADGSVVSLEVGAIIVATGFDTYRPAEGEFGYGREGVWTLPEVKEWLAGNEGPLAVDGRPVESVAYIYCVGSRQPKDSELERPNLYCSRYCCSSALHTALQIHERNPEVHQFHLYRDMRSYGKYELLYEEASRKGSMFFRFENDAPPEILAESRRHIVRAKGQLEGDEVLDIPADLVVLVTGMVPRQNDALINVLKLPVGTDGFFNEIHPKLRPVETVMDGVFIVGASQGPKTLAESVASSLAGVSKSAALLKKGYVDLDPYIAMVNAERCVWCGKCLEACPYGAIEKSVLEGKEIASVIPSLCKGGGACVPVCPEDAIELKGYTSEEITAAIDALIEQVAAPVP
ncbi:MAG: CoB--CoM heterodisulfide reductase iron-sulfur subunit A family protein [Acidobacteria bacterium]|nr:CoB--CoM heterodisulfide reductase iron-sulfur subunit A family protein [Acidobacteriota bacterium]